MIVLDNDVSPEGKRTLTLRLEIGRRIWPRWHYDAERLTVELQGSIFRGSVQADQFTPTELAVIRQAEEVLQRPTPLILANLLEQLVGLTSIRWICGRPVDVADVVRAIRRRAIVS